MKEEDKIRIVIEIDRGLHTEVKTKASSLKNTIKQSVIDLLKDWVKK